ncbi:MAG TPA: nucleotidyl transferase AbiEii/AbiGii toxin family protein [Granulicella sp.]|nr:nucleotidyl transferase AbiEii/AbiGii toxin family protein [Granulicella sp.]
MLADTVSFAEYVVLLSSPSFLEALRVNEHVVRVLETLLKLTVEQLEVEAVRSHRPTRDLDLLGWGSSAIADVEQVVRAICEVAEDDGILFDSQSVEGTRIKEDDEYDGVRIKFRAQLAGARILARHMVVSDPLCAKDEAKPNHICQSTC